MDGEVVVRLPADLRGELKDPVGPVTTDVERLLREAGTPLIAVGDVVTHHLVAAGAVPDLAVVDGMTERELVDAAVESSIDDMAARESEYLPVTIINPAAVLTRDLLLELRAGLKRERPTLIRVEGEEDLGVLPAIVAAPVGASVVYGQPGEGMVHVAVTEGVQERIHDLLSRMEGDYDLLCDLLAVKSRDA